MASYIAEIPRDYTVWAFSDVHGVRSGLAEVLAKAGLIDNSERWCAPPKTALVGIGDYIDRGADSLGVLELLYCLRAEALTQQGMVVPAKGNHEAMLLGILDGRDDYLGTWLSDFAGGRATLTSFGISRDSRVTGRTARDLAIAISAREPRLRDWLRAMPEAVIWRDVLLCHAGPVANTTPRYFGAVSSEHLWQSPDFAALHMAEFNLDSSLFDGYRDEGITRFVFGHESHEGPLTYQRGRMLALDTNATGGAPGIKRATVSLARLVPEGDLGTSRFVFAATRTAPDRA